jgi:F-type H+-transporting ATPase subunit epsilon
VLAGHAPTVALLRPGTVTVKNGGEDARFALLGGFAEFSGAALTVLADDADGIAQFDANGLKARIDDLQDRLGRLSAGDELDRAIPLLDDYKSLRVALAPATAF